MLVAAIKPHFSQGMTLAIQFLDLYFFAYFKHLYSLHIDDVVSQLQVPKLSACEKRIIMTKAVAHAWKKVQDVVHFEDLFRKLGYIHPRKGPIKLDVLPDYHFDPLLTMPVVHSPLTPSERREKAAMYNEDASFPRPKPAPKPKGLRQATLTFTR